MPVTVYPSANKASLLRLHGLVRPDNAADVLNLVYPERAHYQPDRAWQSYGNEELDSYYRREQDRGRMLNNLGVLQSSLEQDFPSGLMIKRKGLLAAVRDAYSSHHHLILRPDDIWQAIMIQLSFYVKAHAEELRASFVAHEGKRELKIVYGGGDRYTFDFAVFLEDMSRMIQNNVVDPELREWMLPAFSTTTAVDKAIGSVLLMSSMQKYFDFTCAITCGLPSVTLLGSKADFELIDQRIDKLSAWGEETTCFRDLLKPITRRLVHTFDAPDADETKEFWGRIFKHENNGSGPTYYSGWITAFACWNEDGERLYGAQLDRSTDRRSGISVENEVDSETEDSSENKGFSSEWHSRSRGRLCMDGIIYHKLADDGIPAGMCTVPVKVVDNGEEVSTEMVAGCLGYSCTSSGEKTENGEIGLDTLQPHSGWFIYEKADMNSR